MAGTVNNFELVKQQTDLNSIITTTTGFQMKKGHLEECPFCSGHDCFAIYKGKNFFNCFQCDTKGDIFDFLQAFHSVDKKEALKRAAEFSGIKLSFKGTPKLKLSVTDKIFIEAAKHYHASMVNNGRLNYLTKKRGHDIEVLKKMQVGSTDGELLGYLRKTFSDDDIIKSGLTKKRKINDEDTWVDYFDKDVLIFPHFYKGKVVHFTTKDPEKKKPAYQLLKRCRNKAWLFYHQDALDRHEEVILVEGENDLLSVLDAKIENVIGMVGQISEEQVKALDDKCRKKTLILWMDNDLPNSKGMRPGHNYVRKICTGCKNIDIKIILYPDNQDPDDYLRAFKGDKRKEVQRLTAEAVDYISWEIIQSGQEKNLEDKLSHLKDHEVFQHITQQPEIKQQIYVEKIEALGFTKKAIAEQLEDKIDLRNRVSLYFATLNSKSDAEPNKIADIIYQCLSKEGRFFYNREDIVYLLYNQHIYEIGSNRPFNALMKKHTTLLYTEQPGRSVWESLASEGYNAGRQIDLARWTHTDRNTDTIFINFNSPNNIIIRCSSKGVTEVPNGLNDDNILLQSSSVIHPFSYLPDTDIRESFRVIKNLIFDNLTCDREQRWFVICWLISGFLLDFATSHALLKFAGGSSAGKSTSARLLSLLMFGVDNLGDTSAAAAFAEASQNPMVIIDNLESGDMSGAILKFLLMAATGGQKTKRTSGTDSGTTKENPKALILVTAIEPFIKAELINRTWEIQFDKKFHSDGWIEDEVNGEIYKKRDLILSGIFKFISEEILPNLSQRKDYITILKKQYRQHAKDRMNEYLAMLMLILDKTLQYIPYYEEDHVMYGTKDTGAAEIRNAWIEYQNNLARETEITSNDILKLFNGMIHEYLILMKERQATPIYKEEYKADVFDFVHPEYGIEIIKTKPETKHDDDGSAYSIAHIEFEATSHMIVSALDKYCRNNGLKNPYSKPSVFGARLKNDVHLLKKGGWELITSEGKEPYYRISRGVRFLRFRHSLIR